MNHRREQRWADKEYKKAHMGTRWKANPFGGASHAKGIVLEKVYVLFTHASPFDSSDNQVRLTVIDESVFYLLTFSAVYRVMFGFR